MRPFRAARSSRLTASRRTSVVESGAFAFLSAVRSAARWARFRTVAARVFRMFFLADAMFGTDSPTGLLALTKGERAPFGRSQRRAGKREPGRALSERAT